MGRTFDRTPAPDDVPGTGDVAAFRKRGPAPTGILPAHVPDRASPAGCSQSRICLRSTPFHADTLLQLGEDVRRRPFDFEPPVGVAHDQGDEAEDEPPAPKRWRKK